MRSLPIGPTKQRSRRSKQINVLALLFAATLALTNVMTSPLSAETRRVRPMTETPIFGVGLARCTFVDHSRAVLNYSKTPFTVWSTSRQLVTEIRYPTQYVAGQPAEIAGALPVEQSGGYPMIVFAHGYDVTPDTYSALLDAWVQAGFVVVAPFFPDEQPSAVAAQHGANTEDDVVNEPADLTFVTKEIIQASANESSDCHVVSGLVQSSEIALAGHSDGATAVGMLAYDHGEDPQGVNYATLRAGINYRAVVILSGAEDTAQSYADEASRPDLLDIHSLADQCNPIRDGVKLYDAIDQPNKWFLALRTAHHLPAFDGADAPAFRVVAATSIQFLHMSLQSQTSAVSLLTYGNEHPSVARMYGGALGRALENAPKVPESCGPD
jgi:predicted dienelactone hydrolase